MVLPYAFRGEFRGLVVEQVRFHGFSELRVQRDGVRTDTGVFVLHVRVVMRVRRVVFSSFSRTLREFVRESAFRNSDFPGYFFLRNTAVQKRLY